MIKKFLTALIFTQLLISICLSVSEVSAATAHEYYTSADGYNKCVNDSHRLNIYSVTNYACKKAIAKAQNACASWIGPAGDSASNVIDATGATGDIPIKIWGMCTYYDNTSSMMQIMNHSDGDSITCADDNCNFNRTGNWGASSIGSKNATLNIAKFIDHAPTTVIDGETYYYRTVILKRQHGGNTSQDLDFSFVYLKVSGSTPPPPPLDTCNSDGWPNPASYTNSNENRGTTSVDIKIRNTADRFSDRPEGVWGNDTIFAKPTDIIAWHTCYYPGVQTTVDTEVSSINGTNWDNYENPLPDDECLASDSSRRDVGYEKLQVAVKEPSIGHDWQNFYTLYGDATTGDLVGQSASIGATEVLESDNGRPTTVDDVGKELTEYANTGEPVHVKISSAGRGNTTVEYSCPCCTDGPDADGKYHDEDGDECSPSSDSNDCAGGCCTNTYSSELKDAAIAWDNPADSASVKIPYNYLKRTGVNIHDDIVYAGETIKIQDVWTMIIPRWNGKTLDAYATKTSGDTEIKLYAYVTPNQDGDKNSFEVANGDGCSVIRTTDKQCFNLDTNFAVLNDSGNLLGKDDHFFEDNRYNVFDASAGDYLCLVSSVSKEESRDNEDMDDTGNGKWAYSEPTCAIIAKRPSFQVWGGDVYSNSAINAVPAQKRNVYNGYKYNIEDDFDPRDPGTTIYGSWVEEGLMFGKDAKTENLASGAATGLNDTSGIAYSGDNEGGDFCKDRSPLTIANYNGTSCDVGSSGITLEPTDEERRELISYWIPTGEDTSPSSATGATIDYTHYNTDTSISTMETPMKIPKSTTKIIEVDGNLTISGNIEYEGHYSGSYTSSDTIKEIPKMIIYAYNVYINCSVKNVDAIIITKKDGTVDTCKDAGDINSSNRSNQLKIFGMVMTDKLILGRTYGQAAWKGLDLGETYDESRKAGNGQWQAAEIFDFDSSILLWSEFMASSAETDTLQTVYQVEIAPRY